MSFTAAVITVSDKSARGERADESGGILEKLLRETGAQYVSRKTVADEQSGIATVLRKFSGERRVDLIITTGGTGMSLRDVTPEATLAVIDREAPGFAEAVRAGSLKHTPFAMLSRAVSGIRGDTLIINLPGSPQACAQSFAVIKPALGHALDLLSGDGGECAR